VLGAAIRLLVKVIANHEKLMKSRRGQARCYKRLATGIARNPRPFLHEIGPTNAQPDSASRLHAGVSSRSALNTVAMHTFDGSKATFSYYESDSQYETLTPVGSFRMTILVGRPKRAGSVSTTVITFRLTSDEARRLAQLAKELGYKDRSTLLRAWIAQSGPIPNIVDDASRLSAQTKTIETAPNAQPLVTPRSNPNDDRPKQIRTSEELTVNDVIELLQTAIRRENDPRSGLSRVAGVVRSLLPGITVVQSHALMGVLHQAGMLELRPDGGEALSDEDAALCPRDARGAVLSRVRWCR